MFDLKSYLSEKKDIVDAALKRLLAEKTGQGQLLDAMVYAVTAGGKRLRPILGIAASESLGEVNNPSVIVAGCALEFIHTYSLIHDDLPAMDDDTLRRGKPTCHSAFDEATAILAGDALLTLAFQVLAEGGLDSHGSRRENWLAVTKNISVAAGPMGMVEGQMRDILSEGQTLATDQLSKIHDLKTGALITSAVTAGAMLSDAPPEKLDALKKYSTCIGMAYQVVDDILNVEGDAVKMGKSVGTDH